MTHKKSLFLLVAFICLHAVSTFAQHNVKTGGKKTGHEPKKGTIVTENLASTVLRDNRVGLDPNRSIKIYLPPGYATSGRSYPVVYYCHNIFWSAEKLFEDGNLVKLLERGFANGVVNEFILVAADYSSPTTGSFYENSTTSGRWLDFTADELVPFIDSKFRTLRHRDCRALTGDFLGGRGAIVLAMTHAQLFSVMYALHPVATGTGYLPWAVNDMDWKKIHEAKTLAELAGVNRAQMFVSMAQAFLPNPNRPPFFCDFWMETENNEIKLHVENTKKAKEGFLLDHILEKNISNLQTMRGFAFDWGRYDPTPTHVYTNQEFARKLEDSGIEHEAEEYRGTPWNKNWTEDGRFYTRVLPFFARHLVFEEKK